MKYIIHSRCALKEFEILEEKKTLKSRSEFNYVYKSLRNIELTLWASLMYRDEHPH